MQFLEIEEEEEGFIFTRRKPLSVNNENRREIKYFNNNKYEAQKKKGKVVQRHESVIVSQDKSSQQTLSPLSPHGNKIPFVTPPQNAIEVYTLSPETTSVHQLSSDHSSSLYISNDMNKNNKYFSKKNLLSIDRKGIASSLPIKVPSNRLYTQIDQNLDNSLRLQQLLVWCIQRKSNEHQLKVIEESISDEALVRNQVLKIQNYIMEQLLEGNIDTSWDKSKEPTSLQCMIPSKKNIRNKDKIKKHQQLIDLLQHETSKWQSEIDKIYEEHASAKDTSIVPINNVDCNKFLNSLDSENQLLLKSDPFSDMDSNNKIGGDDDVHLMKLISTSVPQLLMSKSMEITELRLLLGKALYKQQNYSNGIEDHMKLLVLKIKENQQLSIRKYLTPDGDSINEKRKKIRKLYRDYTEEDKKDNFEFLKLLSSLSEY
ncbi:hypothetical protein BJ944DRAFT_244058 [Cunninghamella echinulata]|nr:hypothetical protein BJ944DRAFT_244058 [Cunninghamella echinulata]